MEVTVNLPDVIRTFSILSLVNSSQTWLKSKRLSLLLLFVVIIIVESFGVHNQINISNASMSQLTNLIDSKSKFVKLIKKMQLVIYQEKFYVQLNC